MLGFEAFYKSEGALSAKDLEELGKAAQADQPYLIRCNANMDPKDAGKTATDEHIFSFTDPVSAFEKRQFLEVMQQNDETCQIYWNVSKMCSENALNLRLRDHTFVWFYKKQL